MKRNSGFSTTLEQSRGYSLIELLIAMSIGLFLIMIAMKGIINSKVSYRANNAIYDINANATAALQAIVNVVGHAGYPSTNLWFIDKAFYVPSDEAPSVKRCFASADGGARVVSNTASNASITTQDAFNDQLSVMFYPDNPNDSTALYWKDCGGSYSNSDARAEKCSADPYLGQGRDALVYTSLLIKNEALSCKSSRGTSNPIAEGIEHMQFSYGVRQLDSLHYKTATEVSTANQWGDVVSIKVGLLVKSLEEIHAVSKSEQFVVLDEIYIKNDRYIRKVFNTTIKLRNLSRES